MDVQVSFRGPIFNGQFIRATAEICDRGQEEVADAALERVQYFLDRSIKHPTPYYETQIIHQRKGLFDVVHDRGIIYGPWLEGVSFRNTRSRFKGYASFRKATQAVDKIAPDIVERVIARNIGRLQ